MFDKMFKALEGAMNDGNNGYEWNCDAESLYNAIWQVTCAGVLTREQWDKINETAEKAANYKSWNGKQAMTADLSATRGKGGYRMWDAWEFHEHCVDKREFDRCHPDAVEGKKRYTIKAVRRYSNYRFTEHYASLETAVTRLVWLYDCRVELYDGDEKIRSNWA